MYDPETAEICPKANDMTEGQAAAALAIYEGKSYLHLPSYPIVTMVDHAWAISLGRYEPPPPPSPYVSSPKSDGGHETAPLVMPETTIQPKRGLYDPIRGGVLRPAEADDNLQAQLWNMSRRDPETVWAGSTVTGATDLTVNIAPAATVAVVATVNTLFQGEVPPETVAFAAADAWLWATGAVNPWIPVAVIIIYMGIEGLSN